MIQAKVAKQMSVKVRIRQTVNSWAQSAIPNPQFSYSSSYSNFHTNLWKVAVYCLHYNSAKVRFSECDINMLKINYKLMSQLQKLFLLPVNATLCCSRLSFSFFFFMPTFFMISSSDICRAFFSVRFPYRGKKERVR